MYYVHTATSRELEKGVISRSEKLHTYILAFMLNKNDMLLRGGKLQHFLGSKGRASGGETTAGRNELAQSQR